MTTYTYSGFEVSDIDLLVFKKWLDILAAATIPDGEANATIFTDVAPKWLWNADSNTNRLGLISGIYTRLMDPTRSFLGIQTNISYGYECATDTEYTAASGDPAKNYKYCNLSNAQVAKFMLISGAVFTWLNIQFISNVINFLVNQA